MTRKLKATDKALLFAFGLAFVCSACIHFAYAMGKRAGIAEQTALILNLRGAVQ